MSSFADLSSVLHRATGGTNGTPQALTFFKDDRTSAGAAHAAAVAGQITSLWPYAGCPTHGSTPGVAANPTNATAGALKQTDPSGGRQLRVLSAGAHLDSNQAGIVMVYDRLLHRGGLSGVVDTAQTVGGAVTRYTGATAAGNEIWLEIYTIIGATPTTVTASYTNQAGTAARTTQAVAVGGTALREVARIIRLPLQSGDTGVRSVETVTLAATTGTAGDFGITIARPLFELMIGAHSFYTARGFLAGQPTTPEIMTGACIAFAVHAHGANNIRLRGGIFLTEV